MTHATRAALENIVVRLVCVGLFAFATWYSYAERQLDTYAASMHIPPPAPWTPALTWLLLVLMFTAPIVMHRALYNPPSLQRP